MCVKGFENYKKYAVEVLNAIEEIDLRYSDEKCGFGGFVIRYASQIKDAHTGMEAIMADLGNTDWFLSGET